MKSFKISIQHEEGLVFDMALIHSPRIVTDGLVLFLDAANKKSYSGSGVNWLDVSGTGNTSTLTNGPTYNSNSNNGIMSFDGTNDYTITSSTPTVLQGNPNFTICGFFRRTANWPANTGLWGIGGNVTGQGICSWYNNNSNEIAIDFWGTSTFTTGTTYPLNSLVFCAWQKIAGNFTRSNCIIWRNLISYTGTQLSIIRAEGGTPNINNQGVTLARISNSYSVPVAVDISNTMIYSKILTESEIQQNFNALRGRYGI